MFFLHFSGNCAAPSIQTRFLFCHEITVIYTIMCCFKTLFVELNFGICRDKKIERMSHYQWKRKRRQLVSDAAQPEQHKYTSNVIVMQDLHCSNWVEYTTGTAEILSMSRISNGIAGRTRTLFIRYNLIVVEHHNT